MTANPNVLVVDDEAPLRGFVRRNLEVRGFRVQTAASGLEALALAAKTSFDLIILDLMMPHMDGLETARRIRQNSYVPILILTALDEERDKVVALDLGADDYLTKPFGVEELMARVKAILRRTSWHSRPAHDQRSVLFEAGIELDPATRRVIVRGQPADLTPIEFDLLRTLMEQPERVFSHRDLLKRVWGETYGGEIEYIRVYIGRLRRKIEIDPGRPELLLTEHGVGYRLTSV
jgi:two-component system KDP operon response regulator KdpE